jgi:flavodoxin
MPNVLVIYDSKTGNTEKAATLVAEGLKKVAGTDSVLKRVQNVSLEDLLKDGNPHAQHYGLAVVGAPSGKEKDLCRRFGARIAELVVKVAGAK